MVKGEQERKVFRELFFLGVQKIKESIEQCPVLVSRLSFLGLMFQGLIVFHVNNSRHSLVCYARMIKGGRSCISMTFFYYGFPSSLIGCTFDLGFQKEFNHERKLCVLGESS